MNPESTNDSLDQLFFFRFEKFTEKTGPKPTAHLFFSAGKTTTMGVSKQSNAVTSNE